MENLINGLFEEYRIVQNKIDKIADFALKVRGWCITLETALIITLMSGKITINSTYYIIGLILFIVLVFQFLEQEQLETKKILSKRALIVEQAIDRILVTRDESHLKKTAINKKIFKMLKGSPRMAIDLKNFGRNRTIKSFKKMFAWKNHIFYYAQYLVILIMLIFSFLGSWDFNNSKNNPGENTTNITCLKSH